MCAIVGSFNKNKLKDLFKLNAYRGELSYSLASFDQDTTLQILMKGDGKMPENFIDDFPADVFYIGHCQAPTVESAGIHPAADHGRLLWHNGIIKQKEIPEGAWDTEWLVGQLKDHGWEYLSEVDGTFACVMYVNHTLYIFRNEISPLFIDDDLNISSTKFHESKSIEPNKVFRIDLINKQLVPVAEFTTKENPYYFD